MPQRIELKQFPDPIINPDDPDQVIPEGRVVMATTTFVLPAAATRAQVMEWFCLHMGYGSMSADNPLSNHEPEALLEPILQERPMRVESNIDELLSGDDTCKN